MVFEGEGRFPASAPSRSRFSVGESIAESSDGEAWRTGADDAAEPENGQGWKRCPHSCRSTNTAK